MEGSRYGLIQSTIPESAWIARGKTKKQKMKGQQVCGPRSEPLAVTFGKIL
jgi:hypothetical protein